MDPSATPRKQGAPQPGRGDSNTVPARRAPSPGNGLAAGLTVTEEWVNCIASRGNSSVGRAQPCQGWGREFESRFPLQISGNPAASRGVFVIGSLRVFRAEWQSGYAADCKSVYLGSIPGSASIFQRKALFARMAKLVDAADLKSAGHCDRAGSSPAPGTNSVMSECRRFCARRRGGAEVGGKSLAWGPQIAVFWSALWTTSPA